MKNAFYLIIVSIIFIFSCSNNNLTNEDALKILKDNYVETCRGNIHSRIDDNQTLSNYSKKLVDEGLINPVKWKYGKKLISLTSFAAKKYNGTTKKEYYLDPVDLLTANVIQINGISQKDKTAVVNFTIEFKETPFYNFRKKENCKLENKIEREIELISYDTGWRIKK